jgi:hypothetical protein
MGCSLAARKPEPSSARMRTVDSHSALLSKDSLEPLPALDAVVVRKPEPGERCRDARCNRSVTVCGGPREWRSQVSVLRVVETKRENSYLWVSLGSED